MPSAPNPAPANAPATPPPPRQDARFARVPMVRHAMTLIVPRATTADPNRHDRITVREITTGGRVIVDEGGVERSVDLNVVELRQLADHLQRIARRVARRPEGRP